MRMTQTPPPGWYSDPGNAQQQRYWDGSAWTQHVNALVVPPAAPPPPPALPAASAVVPAAAPSAAARFTLPRLLWIALIAAGATFVGTLMPWVSVLVFSVNGTQTGDGKVVLVCALVSAALIATASRGKRLYRLAALTGLIAFGACLYDTIRALTAHGDFFDEEIGASPGAGLWIALISSAVLVGAVVKNWRDE
jgi:hypothetical protein